MYKKTTVTNSATILSRPLPDHPVKAGDFG